MINFPRTPASMGVPFGNVNAIDPYGANGRPIPGSKSNCSWLLAYLGRKQSGITLLSTNRRGGAHAGPVARTQIVKVITQKQKSLAIEHVARLLKQDGAIQTLTVQEWLDAAQFRPAQFPTSLPALEVLGLLGFGDEMVNAQGLG